MSLWQELESLQRKKAELDDQLLPVVEKEQNSLEMIVIIMEGMEIQEEHMRELEVQLNDKHEAVSKLESKIVELEKTLKKPVKEPVEQEPVMQEPIEQELVKEPTMEELEKQPMEMTVQTAALAPQRLTFWELVALGLGLE